MQTETNKKAMVIIVFIVLLSVFIGLAVYLMSYSNNNVPNVTPTPSPSLTPAPSSSPTSEVKSAVLNEDFLITLPANPSTGYSWEAQYDENYLTLRSKDFVQDKGTSPDTVGAGGTEVFTFTPIKSGDTAITMLYKRSWEKEALETKEFNYKIVEKEDESPIESPIDFYSCINDSDCIKTSKDCCGCNAGGEATAINKNFENDWKSKSAKDCKEIMCPAVMSNDPSCFENPKCVSNKCILK